MHPLAQKHVVLGVAGGIAAYKVVQLARNLSLAGALVDVVMTKEATQFVTPLTFQALTHRPVHTDMWQMNEGVDITHVSLGDNADVVVIAPATAHTIARIAHGFSDDLLTTTILATRAPVVVAPAMNVHMWANPATVENVATLRRRGIQIIEPSEGRMAEPMVGVGRLADIEVIEAELAALMGRIHGPLRGWNVVVTAGGTHEPIDPVRFIGNRSSGTMGYALAAACRDHGANVTLISGPATATPPIGIPLVHVETAQAMHDAVHAAITECDLLIMAAAVADYRPTTIADEKIKKTAAGATTRSLNLSQTTDILGSLQGITEPIKVGFAAETQDIARYAQDKLQRKGLDLIVANDARLALGASDNAVTVYAPDGASWDIERQPKAAVAAAIVTLIEQRWPQPRRSGPNTTTL